MQADLIVNDAETENTRPAARAAAIIRALDRMDRMIRDLLDAKRIAFGGTLALRLDKVDLGKLCAAALEELAVLHGDRFQLEAQDGVLGSWDRDELHRAFWNLITNAVRYGDSSAPVIARVYVDGAFAYMTVHNEGPPIPPEDLPNLFKPFSRARTAGVLSGWGLGLTLVRACAEGHGGDVKVESTPGSGTTFILRLPLRTQLERSGL
jgi:signal transduction histidine kinase